MKRRNFIASLSALSALAAAACSPRLDERKERYDKKECPFCTTDKGTCNYCHGDTKWGISYKRRYLPTLFDVITYISI